MDDQNKNLILAFGLSLVVMVVWFALFPPAETPPGETVSQAELLPPPAQPLSDATQEPSPAAEIVESVRINIDTPRMTGTIALTGGRFDDLQLRDYRETVDADSDLVHLLNPAGGPRHSFYALYGWSPRGDLDYAHVPGPNTAWQQAGTNDLTPETPVVLEWDNGTGLIFTRTISVDENFVFSIDQAVQNNTDAAVSLDPYGMLAQHGIPEDIEAFFISHEGLVLQADGNLTEDSYGNMEDYDVSEREQAPTFEATSTESGWVGFTSKYFMASLIGTPGQTVTTSAQYLPNSNIYRTTLSQPTVTVTPGETAQVGSQLFTGAKDYDTLELYEDAGIERFTDAIDWGWFFFLTRPIFLVLNWIHGIYDSLSVPGSMGWAILTLTLILKAILLPLAWKSYVSMARMKELQPEMQKIKERAGDDRQKLQQEMMTLYREKKVNPAAGCLPILLQIPIFFSLYKVIFVTIELRHAPWIWRFNDLSAPDPTSILNLFGALPFDGPVPGSLMATLFLGILPLLFGLTMWFQMRLNPAPTDAMQAAIFNWMPFIFMFVMGGFASGLLIYWIGNNIITFTQQYLIMSAHGSRPDLFGNIKASIGRSKSGKGT